MCPSLLCYLQLRNFLLWEIKCADMASNSGASSLGYPARVSFSVSFADLNLLISIFF